MSDKSPSKDWDNNLTDPDRIVPPPYNPHVIVVDPMQGPIGEIFIVRNVEDFEGMSGPGQLDTQPIGSPQPASANLTGEESNEQEQHEQEKAEPDHLSSDQANEDQPLQSSDEQPRQVAVVTPMEVDDAVEDQPEPKDEAQPTLTSDGNQQEAVQDAEKTQSGDSASTDDDSKEVKAPEEKEKGKDSQPSTTDTVGDVPTSGNESNGQAQPGANPGAQGNARRYCCCLEIYDDDEGSVDYEPIDDTDENQLICNGYDHSSDESNGSDMVEVSVPRGKAALQNSSVAPNEPAYSPEDSMDIDYEEEINVPDNSPADCNVSVNVGIKFSLGNGENGSTKKSDEAANNEAQADQARDNSSNMKLQLELKIPGRADCSYTVDFPKGNGKGQSSQKVTDEFTSQNGAAEGSNNDSRAMGTPEGGNGAAPPTAADVENVDLETTAQPIQNESIVPSDNDKAEEDHPGAKDDEDTVPPKAEPEDD